MSSWTYTSTKEEEREKGYMEKEMQDGLYSLMLRIFPCALSFIFFSFPVFIFREKSADFSELELTCP